jgi:CheY-like chemotaxis protein
MALRILIAEDDELHQRLLLRILNELGYEADVVGSGTEALSSLERKPYDLLFMDVRMSEMDGLEATRAIVSRWEKRQRPIIVGVTADALQGDREACVQAGMDDYLSKPIQVEDLQEVFERWGKSFEQPLPPRKTSSPAADSARLEESLTKRIEQLGMETDFDFILELIDSYKPMLETKLNELSGAYSSKDMKKFRFTVHSLKGAALNIGANDYAAVCKEMEDQTSDGELIGLEGLLAELAKAQSELLRTLLVVKEKLQAKSG